ncbi:hypothetical protein I3760_05G119000 [Carya illinoinensis]|nr:hypothetical protein I3760_05G119000 [Carya illinoinensis]
MGTFGGVLLMWDIRVVEKMEYIEEYTVAYSFQNVEDRFRWTFARIYWLTLDSNRHLLWEELAGLHSSWDIPWCIGEEFNVVKIPSERWGDSKLRTAMSSFSDCIFELGLADISLMGGTFTWSNNQTRSRLDRFLVSPE